MRTQAFIAIVAIVLPALVAAETWMGLEVVTPEHRCSEYDRADYRYDAAGGQLGARA